MVNKLTNNISNESSQDSSSKINLKEAEGKAGVKSPQAVKWVIWVIVLAALIAMFWWLFSAPPTTLTVANFSINPSATAPSTNVQNESKDSGNGPTQVEPSQPDPKGLLDANAFQFTISGNENNPFSINIVKGGSLMKLDDTNFIYTISVGNYGYARFAGVITYYQTTSNNETRQHPIFQLTALGNSFFYEQDSGKIWVGISNDPAKAAQTYNITSIRPDLKWLAGMNTQIIQLSEQGKNMFWNILISCLPIIILLVLMFAFVRKRGLDGEGDSVFTIGKSLAKLAKTKTKFTDVAGIAEEKQELIEIVDYLKRPGKYVAMGARIPRGVILYGPPGTGKTLLAKAVAGEAQVPFFQIAGSAFEDMLVGVGAKRIRDMFNKAKKVAPCIIFIDEIDSIGGKRGRSEIAGGNYSISEQTINQLLGEMDGFETKTGIIVIAATNRIDVLDEALLRPGRFDRHIKISLPDIKEREEILVLHARNKNFSSKINFADISRRTPGFSGAQLENTLNEAVLLAVRNNRTVILESDVDEAIDRIIAGPAKVSRTMTDTERKQIAFHEAGHALTGLYLKNNEEIQKITIIPRGNAGGYTLSAPKSFETNLKRKSELLDMIAVCLGGRASEEIIFGKDNISSGASDDLYKATNIVRNMVMQLGMSSLGKTQYIPSQGTVNPGNVKLYSDETALAIDREIDAILNQEYKRSSEIISNNIDELKLIVDALLTVETIVKHDIEFIHNNKRLPDEIIAIKKKTASSKLPENDDSSEKTTVSENV